MRPTSLAPRAPQGLARSAAAAAVMVAAATHVAGCAAPTSIIGAALAAVTVRIMMLDLALRIIDRRDLAVLVILGVAHAAFSDYDFMEYLSLSVISCAIFAIALLGIKLLYRRVRHVEGLGSGDIELVAASGFLLDLADLAASLWVGALFTAVYVLVRVGRRPSRRIARMRAPYGCFLAAASLTLWLLRTVTGGGAVP